MRTFTLTLITVVSSLHGTVDAAVTVDSFGGGALALTTLSTNGSSFNGSQADGSISGGSREVDLALATGLFGSTVTGEVNTVAGIFNYESGTFANGSAALTYDASGAGLNLDLSSATAVEVEFLATDLNFPVTVTIGDGTNTQSVTLNTTGPGTMVFSLGAFGVPLDLTDIDSLVVSLDPIMAGDFAITEIRISGTTSTSGGSGGGGGGGGAATAGVEPHGIVLWILGLGCSFYVARRNRRGTAMQAA
ncbi:MAG: hypothetical protein O3A00_13155 [Planctomycetota bacterium]|nr:hypothetical protein [Planctomycetota bacterium]